MSRSLTFRLKYKDAVTPNPLAKEESCYVYNCIDQDQLNAGFSNVCEIFISCGIESLKCVQEFYTLVCYCGNISTPRT